MSRFHLLWFLSAYWLECLDQPILSSLINEPSGTESGIALWHEVLRFRCITSPQIYHLYYTARVHPYCKQHFTLEALTTMCRIITTPFPCSHNWRINCYSVSPPPFQWKSSKTHFWRVCYRDSHLQLNVLSIVHETIGFSQQSLISHQQGSASLIGRH